MQSQHSVGALGARPSAVAEIVARKAEARQRTWTQVVRDYAAIARPDHWFKNVFMLVGVLLAFFYHPELLQAGALGTILWALAAVCLVASSNYVINEILDAPTDLSHPIKRSRPIPSGRVWLPLAYLEWIVLGGVGLSMAYALSLSFFAAAAALLVMGVVYNVPPLRSKNLPYVDVLSESVNNPLRLLLGWFAVTPAFIPPLSLLLAYWMVGAFFMAAKRFAEYRSLGDPSIAAAYRPSFAYYTEQNLLISMVFYVTTFALFLGVFIIRYHVELILIFPLVAGFICFYLHISFRHNSPVQSPEHLYREKKLMAFLCVCVLAFVGLMFVHIPAMYSLFNIEPSPVPALWRLGE
jgi:decaprenyl-phosphate phosphoribosyltransferase